MEVAAFGLFALFLAVMSVAIVWIAGACVVMVGQQLRAGASRGVLPFGMLVAALAMLMAAAAVLGTVAVVQDVVRMAGWW